MVSVSIIFRFNFGIVLTMWYFVFFISFSIMCQRVSYKTVEYIYRGHVFRFLCNIFLTSLCPFFFRSCTFICTKFDVLFVHGENLLLTQIKTILHHQCKWVAKNRNSCLHSFDIGP
jgi:hypothetical protein